MERSTHRGFPRTVRLILISWAMGAGIGALVAAAVLGMNGSMLGQLVGVERNTLGPDRADLRRHDEHVCRPFGGHRDHADALNSEKLRHDP